MAQRNYTEHARATAICVNMALDGVEADIRDELDRVTDEAAAALRRVSRECGTDVLLKTKWSRRNWRMIGVATSPGVDLLHPATC